jgi:hypothetical protein
MMHNSAKIRMNCLFFPLLKDQSRAFLDVVFEWLVRVIAKIGPQWNILVYADCWIKMTTLCRRADWKWLACKN